MFIDTHCHLYKEYYDDLEKIIKDAINNNVKIMIVNGVDRKSNEEVMKLVKKYPNLYGTLGYYPSNIENITSDDFKFLEDNLHNAKIIGIGEIGLDYYWRDDNKEEQKSLFEKQLKIAVDHQKPVIIHNRKATNDLYDILKRYKLKGIIHCFNENVEIAKKFTDLGFFLGIGGIVTFKNASNIITVTKDINLENLVVETDSPYITPEPHRGKQNNPANISYIVKKIAQIKCMNFEEVAAIIVDNTERLFDFSFKI